MSDIEWLDPVVPGPAREGAAGAPGLRGRLVQMRNDLRVRWLVFRVGLYGDWLGFKHRRLGLHTFAELDAWDLDRDCLQYRGWRCLVCDEPMPL